VPDYLELYLGHKPLALVKPEDVRGYRLYLEKQPICALSTPFSAVP